MAEFIDDCVRSAVLKLNNSRKSKRELVLKREQEIAVKDLLLGKHVLAVLPTGYGKSLIFTLFLLAQENMAKINKTERSSVLVISPLRSIIEDQIAEMLSMDFSAVELSDKNVSEVVKSPPQYIYASAESAINKAFLDSLKNSNSAIHRSIALIVVDESHTVETWTGKRSKRGSSIQSEAFRDAYGKLAILRSMCKERTPVLALTA
ncbi:uncharacterized protein LOC114523482 [Dendronephthya gigantea]|uniref:uncharacterized protein LOC114523482 n=1 Tax=Dendronephthya gigantea TaxID=151771 RepID=UPI00106CB63D|nr:uncharacterized protein LOC114523482 [Dendronephthya gigantea]